MRRTIATLLIVLACNTGRALDRDKVTHVGVSAAATAASYVLFRAVLNAPCRNSYPAPPSCPLTTGQRLGAASLAFFLVSFVGLAKEGFDRRFDPGDVLANEVGAGAVAGSIILLEF